MSMGQPMFVIVAGVTSLMNMFIKKVFATSRCVIGVGTLLDVRFTSSLLVATPWRFMFSNVMQWVVGGCLP